jgi:hypothetical protein
MIITKVVYDRYNRTFKLLDKEFETVLTDGEHYDLQLPAEEQTFADDCIMAITVPMAHA